MKRQMVRYFWIPLSVFFVVNCAVITVNIYFPTEAVEKAAEKIINEIASGEEPQTIPEENKPQGLLWKNVPHYSLGNATVYAEDIDLNITTPAIRTIIERMKTRYHDIARFNDTGVVGESYDGMLVIREMGGLTGEDIRTVKRVLSAENSDREMLYKELATANKISLSEIDKIKTIFAETRREKAKAGDWFKDKNGTWSQE